MKILPEHYKKLELSINNVLSSYPEILSGLENKSGTYRRWVLYNTACDIDRYTLARELYAYLNDDHIDTALRKITAIK